MQDLSAYNDPEDKYRFELTPAPYSRLTRAFNSVIHTTRRVKNRVITIKDVSVAHTQQLIADVKELKNDKAALARIGIMVTVPVVVFLMAPRGPGMARVKRIGYPLLAIGASSTLCYPKPTWNLTKSGGNGRKVAN